MRLLFEIFSDCLVEWFGGLWLRQKQRTFLPRNPQNPAYDRPRELCPEAASLLANLIAKITLRRCCEAPTMVIESPNKATGEKCGDVSQGFWGRREFPRQNCA
jgi:hypothetical protein